MSGEDPKVKAAVNLHALEIAGHLTNIADIIQDEIRACIEEDTQMSEALYRECGRLLKEVVDTMDSFRKSMGH